MSTIFFLNVRNIARLNIKKAVPDFFSKDFEYLGLKITLRRSVSERYIFLKWVYWNYKDPYSELSYFFDNCL